MKVTISLCVICVVRLLFLDYAIGDVTNITVGYLTVDKTEKYVRNRQGRIISGAISYAIEKINANPNILPDYHINLVWGDTQANTLVGTKLVTEQWRQGAVAFFGLEDSCSVEARVAAAWNLPMISYVSVRFFITLIEIITTRRLDFSPFH